MKSTLQENAQPARTVGDSFEIVSDPGSRHPTQAIRHSAAEKKAASARAGNVNFLMRVTESSPLSNTWSLTQEVADVHQKLLRNFGIVTVWKTSDPTISINQHKAGGMNWRAGGLF